MAPGRGLDVTDKELAKLRALAESATPGPWIHNEYGSVRNPYGQWMLNAGSVSDAAYIAAASPQTVLALLDEIERLRSQRDPLRPLTPREIEAALHEGRAEAVAATGDNAWTSLLRQRDEARQQLAAAQQECERLSGRLDDWTTSANAARNAASTEQSGTMPCEHVLLNCSKCTAERDALRMQLAAMTAARDEVLRDARRYWRLRVLGAAPGGWSRYPDITFLCFTNLDAYVDEDIANQPSRGEAELRKVGAK